jgi:hypothetical protein
MPVHELKIDFPVAEEEKEEPERYQCKACYEMFEGDPFGFRYVSVFSDLRKDTVWSIIRPIPICSMACHNQLVDRKYTIFTPPAEMLETIKLKVFLTKDGEDKSFIVEHPKPLIRDVKRYNEHVVHRFLSAKYGYYHTHAYMVNEDLGLPRRWHDPERLGAYLERHPGLAEQFTPPVAMSGEWRFDPTKTYRPTSRAGKKPEGG